MTGKNPLQLHWLDPRNPQQAFPPVECALAEPNGLLAVGGDLSVTRLLRAYRHGIFPWFNPDEPIMWWAPNPRAVFVPEQIHVSRSLKKALRRQDFAITFDRAFDQVINACSDQREHGTWLGPAMQQAYIELYRRGIAHSLEVWRQGVLIGGLYGIAMGQVFFGESMFSRADNVSKIALVYLARQLSAWDFQLIDCQVGSAHLERLGAQYLPQHEFQSRLSLGIPKDLPTTGSWRFDIDVPTSAEHLPRATDARMPPSEHG